MGGPDRARDARRSFLKKGVVGGVLLFLGGSLPIAIRSTLRKDAPRGRLKLLTLDEHAILTAVAARVVPGDSAGPKWPTAAAVDCAGKVDDLMSRVHPEVGADFRRLLRLFENGMTGLFTAFQPQPFTRLSPDEQDRRLEAWRRSRIDLFRSGYQAMARLALATYYSSPEVYPAVGYPGPPVVPT